MPKGQKIEVDLALYEALRDKGMNHNEAAKMMNMNPNIGESTLRAHLERTKGQVSVKAETVPQGIDWVAVRSMSIWWQDRQTALEHPEDVVYELYTVRMPATIKRKIQQEAEATGDTIAEVVTRAMRYYFEKK
jgi:hypothetical protein